MAPKIGDQVWLFNGNHRVYPRDAQGKPVPGGPVFREHFRPYQIIGETRTSWCLDRGEHYRIDKKTLRLRKPEASGYYGLSPIVYFSIQEVDDACWVNDNRNRISELVRLCNNVAALRTILGILEANR
jgi:hypothetical protein